MNRTLSSIAITTNALSLLALHSGLDAPGYDPGESFVTVFILLVWLIGNIILIYYLALAPRPIMKSKLDGLTLFFCTPVPFTLYFLIHYFFLTVR